MGRSKKSTTPVPDGSDSDADVDSADDTSIDGVDVGPNPSGDGIPDDFSPEQDPGEQFSKTLDELNQNKAEIGGAGDFSCEVRGCPWTAPLDDGTTVYTYGERQKVKRFHMYEVHGLRTITPEQKRHSTKPVQPVPQGGEYPGDDVTIDPDTMFKGEKAMESIRKDNLKDALKTYFSQNTKLKPYIDYILKIWERVPGMKKVETGPQKLYQQLMNLTGVSQFVAGQIVEMTFNQDAEEGVSPANQPFNVSYDRQGYAPPPNFNFRSRQRGYNEAPDPDMDRQPSRQRRGEESWDRPPRQSSAPGNSAADIERIVSEKLEAIEREKEIREMERRNRELETQLQRMQMGGGPQRQQPQQSEEMLQMQGMLQQMQEKIELMEEQKRVLEQQKESDKIRHEREMEKSEWRRHEDELLDKIDDVVAASQAQIQALSQKVTEVRNQPPPAPQRDFESQRQIQALIQEVQALRTSHAETLRDIEQDMEYERQERARESERKSFEQREHSLLEKMSNLGTSNDSDQIKLLTLQTGATQKMIDTGLREGKDLIKMWLTMNRPMSASQDEDPEVEPPKPRRRMYMAPQQPIQQYQPPPQQYQQPPPQYQPPPQQQQYAEQQYEQAPQQQAPPLQTPPVVANMEIPKFGKRRRRLAAATEDEVAALRQSAGVPADEAQPESDGQPPQQAPPA